MPDAKIGFSIAAYSPFNGDEQVYIGIISHYTLLSRDVQENVTLNGEDVNDIANSSMLGLDLGFRYYPSIYFLNIEPYVEVNLGARSFYTVTKSFFPDLNETTDRQTNEFNVVLAYGFACGTHIFVNDETAINLKVNFQLSNIARYYVDSPENPNNTNPLDNFDLETSQTDFIRYDLGVSYFF